MKKILSTVILFFIVSSFSSAQNSFIKVLGRNLQDVYSDMEETNDNGIIFSGTFYSNYSLTRCDSTADTLWTKNEIIQDVNLSSICVLDDGRIGISGTKGNDEDEQGAVIITDSEGSLVNSRYFNINDGWGMYGINVFAMPGSGVMLTTYEDGYTCSNSVGFYNLDQSLNSIWEKGIGVCDADLYYSQGIESESQRMSFIKLHYYESDTAGNWHNNVPEIIFRDINGNVLFDSMYFIFKNFSGISNASDGGALIYGTVDTLGSRQIFLTKISSTGTISWTTTFGTNYDDVPVSVVEMDDHGFAILSSQYFPGSNTGADLGFNKVDSQGQLQFSKNYGSTGNEYAVKMIKKKNGSLLLLGRTNGFGTKVNMVIQLDESGNFTAPYSILSAADHFCYGDTAVLTVMPPAQSYLWSNGATTPSISVTSSGNYHLTVFDLSGNEFDVPVSSVYFDAQPDASILNGASLAICDGSTANLTVKEGNGNSYQWFLNGSIIDTATHRIYKADVEGTYSVIVSNSCGADTSDDVHLIHHANPPQPQINVFPSANVCNNTPLQLSTSSTGVTLQWKWAGNTVNDDTLILMNPDYYYVSVVATDSFGCVSPQQSQQVTIDSQPLINFVDSITTICTPGSSTIPYTYSASYGMFNVFVNGSLVNTTTYPPLISQANSSVIKMVMTNACGSFADSVTVNAVPKPLIEIYPSEPKICSGSPVTITCLNQGSYLWAYGDTTPSTLVSTTGSNYLIFTDGVTGCASYKSFYVDTSLDVSPVINLLTDTTLCIGESVSLYPGNFYTYLWSNGSVDSVFTVTNTGNIDTLNITVTVMNDLNCSATEMVSVRLDVCTTVEESNLMSNTLVYPNPASEKIFFNLPANFSNDKVSAKIFNVDGKLMFEKNFTQNNLEINAEDFPASIYFYVIQSQNERFSGMLEVLK